MFVIFHHFQAPAAYWAMGRRPGCAEKYVMMPEADAEDAAHSLAEAPARRTLQDEGWNECPTCRAVFEGAARPASSTEERGGGSIPNNRDSVLMPALSPSSRRCSAHRQGHTRKHGLAPYLASRPPQCHHKQCALRRRLQLLPLLNPNRCRPNPACGGPVDAFGDHPLACPGQAFWPDAPKWWSELGSALRAKQSEPRAKSCRNSGSLTQPPPASLQAIAGASISWFTWTRTCHPQPCTAAVDGAALQVAERRKRVAYPELSQSGPEKLLVFGCEVGGRWSAMAQCFVRDLVRLRTLRAPVPWLVEAVAGNSFRGGLACLHEHSTWTPMAGCSLFVIIFIVFGHLSICRERMIFKSCFINFHCSRVRLARFDCLLIFILNSFCRPFF